MKNVLRLTCAFMIAFLLAPIAKFTVQPGGKFDNGIATNNQLGSDRVIVPVKS